jgi:SAM-dependent methyltransferase
MADTPVRDWLDAYHYNVDLRHVVGNARFERVQCTACAMTFHRHVLCDDDLSRLYGEWIDDQQVIAFEQSWYRDHPDDKAAKAAVVARYLRAIKRAAGHGAKVLDFGCGAGAFVAAAATAGFEATGIDFSATRQDQSNRTGVSIVGHLAELPSGYRADAVTLFEVLEHLADPSGVLRDLSSLMHDGGIVLVTVPDCEGITVPNNWEDFTRIQMLEHVNHFTAGTLDTIFERAGFDHIAEPWAWNGLKPTLKRILRDPPATQRWYRKRRSSL